jgi:hypothetical protein
VKIREEKRRRQRRRGREDRGREEGVDVKIMEDLLIQLKSVSKIFLRRIGRKIPMDHLRGFEMNSIRRKELWDLALTLTDKGKARVGWEGG